MMNQHHTSSHIDRAPLVMPSESRGGVSSRQTGHPHRQQLCARWVIVEGRLECRWELEL